MALLVCERGGDFFFLDELQRREGEREEATQFLHTMSREKDREMMTHKRQRWHKTLSIQLDCNYILHKVILEPNLTFTESSYEMYTYTCVLFLDYSFVLDDSLLLLSDCIHVEVYFTLLG